uniref:Uncharacterized protein n=1 Tax=Anguilla anguilla TaxID=7936 RepID=A0A0E9TV40_ANGAN
MKYNQYINTITLRYYSNTDMLLKHYAYILYITVQAQSLFHGFT